MTLQTSNRGPTPRRVRNCRIAAVVLFSILGAILISLYWHRDQFARDLRAAVATSSDGIERCDFRNDQARNCSALDNSSEDVALIKALSNAEASLEPGKVPIVSERILRIRARGFPIGQYTRCYRLVEFEGFEELYVTEVEMDRGCVRIERYMTGSARIFPGR